MGAQLVGVDVELAVAEPIDPPDLAVDRATLVVPGQRDEPGDQPGCVDLVAQLRGVDTGGEVGGGGGEDVAPRERRARRGQLMLGAGERDHTLGAAQDGDGRSEQAVVGAEKDRVLDLDGDESAVGADAGVDDRQDDAAVGQVLRGPHQRENPGAHVVNRELVGDVDDLEVRGEAEHHRLAHPDELVGVAVVGQERDEPPGERHPDRIALIRPACTARPDRRRHRRRALGTSAHSDCRQVPRLDQAIDRHRRHSHQLGHFLNSQEARFGERLRHCHTSWLRPVWTDRRWAAAPVD